MKKRKSRLPIIGALLLSSLVMASGAKVSMILPFTESGRTAWRDFGSAMAAADAETLAEGDLARDSGPPDGGAQASVEDARTAGAPVELLRSIARERELLAEQKKALMTERAEIALAREALGVEIEQLTELRIVISQILEKAEAAHEADITKLTALYKEMKPADAAEILSEMNLEVTVNVISSMKERNAADIMSKLPPNVTQAISMILLERSKLPGDQEPVMVRLK